MKVLELEEKDFEQEVVKHEGVVLAKFYGAWCGPCKMVAGILDQIPEEKYGSIKIVSLNVDQCMNLAKQFGVMTVPTFIFFKDGGEVEKIVGFRNQRQILELMDKYI